MWRFCWPRRNLALVLLALSDPVFPSPVYSDSNIKLRDLFQAPGMFGAGCIESFSSRVLWNSRGPGEGTGLGRLPTGNGGSRRGSWERLNDEWIQAPRIPEQDSRPPAVSKAEPARNASAATAATAAVKLHRADGHRTRRVERMLGGRSEGIRSGSGREME
jgi:hypothetical protein